MIGTNQRNKDVAVICYTIISSFYYIKIIMILLINKPLEYSLKIVGLWPHSSNFIGPMTTASTLISTLPFQCWKVLNLHHDPIALMDSLSDILSETLILIKFIIMWKNRSYISVLLLEIFEDWKRHAIPDEWKSTARYCKIFCTVDICIYLSAHFMYYPELLMSYIGKPIESRKFIFQSRYPFDSHKSPAYEIVNIMQAVQGLLMITVDSLSKTLLVALIFHVNAHIEMFKSHVQVYSKNCIDFYRNRNNGGSIDLRHVIKEHLKIINLVRKVDTVYTYISFIQILFSNITICVTGFVIIVAMKSANIMLLIKFIAFILVMLSEAFAFCLTGQYLRNKGESIVFIIYDCLWYNAEPKDIKSITFILARAQKSLTLTGGKLFDLSTNTFTMIVKTSVSYLSVLRAVYD